MARHALCRLQTAACLRNRPHQLQLLVDSVWRKAGIVDLSIGGAGQQCSGVQNCNSERHCEHAVDLYQPLNAPQPFKVRVRVEERCRAVHGAVCWSPLLGSRLNFRANSLRLLALANSHPPRHLLCGPAPFTVNPSPLHHFPASVLTNFQSSLTEVSKTCHQVPERAFTLCSPLVVKPGCKKHTREALQNGQLPALATQAFGYDGGQQRQSL